jgi:methyltransferase
VAVTVPDSVSLYSALVGIVAVQRLLELRLSARNATVAIASGAVEVGTGHYSWMVALHATFLFSCPFEVWILRRPFVPLLAAAMAVLLVAATLLRYAAIRALGTRWTTRAFSWPDRKRIDSGPYRLFRHPNYVAVRLEILALPLLHTAWLTALVFTALNGWLLHVRTSAEERGLGDVPSQVRIPPIDA